MITSRSYHLPYRYAVKRFVQVVAKISKFNPSFSECALELYYTLFPRSGIETLWLRKRKASY